MSALKESLMTAERISFADRGGAALSDKAIDVIYVIRKDRDIIPCPTWRILPQSSLKRS